jgi:hypothetical protein
MRLLHLDYVMTSYTNARLEAALVVRLPEGCAVAETPWADDAPTGN